MPRALTLITTSLVALVLAGCGTGSRLHVLPTLPPPPTTPPGLGLIVSADAGGTITVLENAARTVTRTITIEGSPAAIASVGDGTTILVAANGADGVHDRLVRVNVRTGEVHDSIDLGSEQQLASIAVTPDGKTAAVLAGKTSELILVRLADSTIATRRSFAKETLRSVVAVDDARVAIAAGNSVLIVPIAGGDPTVRAFTGPVTSVASRGSKIVATVAVPAQLVVIDLAAATARRGAPAAGPSIVDIAGALGLTAVGLTPDGASAIVADGGRSTGPLGSETYRVRLTSGETTAFGSVGQGPRSLVVDGAGVTWVANRASSSVTILSSDGAFQLELPTGTHPVGLTTVKAMAPTPAG